MFNTGILAAGTALLKTTGFAAAVFLVGVFAAMLSVRASQVAHGYYRQARDRVRRIEATLNAGRKDFRFDTTPGLAGRRSARVNVSAVNYLLLAGWAVLWGVPAWGAAPARRPVSI